MADSWIYRAPGSGPDVFKNAPGGDRWFQIPTGMTVDTAWVIYDVVEQNTSWHIQNLFEQDTAWVRYSGVDQDSSWHIQTEFNRYTAWVLFEELITWLTVFHMGSIDDDFKLNALTSTFALGKLKADYEILGSFKDTFGVVDPLIATFNLIPGLAQTFEIVDDLPETKHIQPIGTGSKRPSYE